jgi:alpha,alpha-trehalase
MAGLSLALVAGCQSAPAIDPAPAAQGVSEEADLARLAPPSERYPDLFQRIALSGLVDPKDWVDAEPKAPADMINAAFERKRPATQAELSAFVETYFDLPDSAPDAAPAPIVPEGLSLSEHIEALWPHLTRQADAASGQGSLIPLPEPYIVPGGRFREVYYWDSYFTMTGLGPEHEAIKRSMVENFASLIREVGHVPNANRTYYLSRSQPPFFFAMVGLLTPDDPAESWAEYLPELQTEYEFWMQGDRTVVLEDGSVLNRYWDARNVPRDESYVQDFTTATRSGREPAEIYRELRAGAESGWDFSSRWLEDPEDLSTIRTTWIVPVDLNALLYGMERAIEAGCAEAGNAICVGDFSARAEARQRAMNTFLWDETLGVFNDYDLEAGRSTGRVSAASLYPLFFGMATEDQAERTADFTLRHLLAPGGLLSTPLETGEQWDAPNGWAPLQWIAVNGFRDSGNDVLAEEIAARWLATVSRTYCETGKLVEKYDVTEVKPGGGGEYPLQDGFGWTNGVTLALLDLYPDLSAYGDIVPSKICTPQ